MDDDLEDLDLIQDNIFGITDEGIDMTAMTPMPPSLSRSSSSDVMSEVNETDRRIRIVHISDTHNNIPDIHSLQPANIFIHTGDFSNRGTPHEFAQFNDFLGQIAHMYPIRIVVFGNHDCRMAFDDMKSLLPNATHVPSFESLNILGLKFLFAPWIADREFDFPGAMRWVGQNRDVHLLCTHSPGYGVLDYTVHGFRVGSKLLKSALIHCKPMCHLFGHVHEEYGYCKTGLLSILSVNSALCGCPTREIVHRGHVISFLVKPDGVGTRLLGIEEL